MDIKRYEIFLKVVERGGFSQAAEDLGYTRSALSKMFAGMEAEIGFPLVKRNVKGVELNEEGKKVLPLIRQLVGDYHRLEEEFQAITGIARGSLKIGCFPTLAYLLMPDIIARFSKTYPGITVEILEENSLHQLESWLGQGIIDIAFFSREEYHKYEFIEIMEEEYVAILPEGHPLLSMDVVPVEQLLEQRIVVFKSQEGYDQDMIKLKRLDFDLNESYGTNSVFFMEKMVADNGCVGIVPLSVATDARAHQNIDYRPMDCNISRIVGFAVKNLENLPITAKKFLTYVKKEL